MKTIEYSGKQYEIDDFFLQVKESERGGLWIVSVGLGFGKRINEIHHIGADLTITRNNIVLGVPWKPEDGFLLWEPRECSPGIPVSTVAEVKAIIRLFKNNRKRAHRIFFGGKCACGNLLSSQV